MNIKHSFQFWLTLSIQICLLFVISMETTELKRFIVVSGYQRSGLSYPDIKKLHPGLKVDIAKSLKGEMCNDILTNYHFRGNNQRPFKKRSFLPSWRFFSRDDWPVTDIKVIVRGGDNEEEFDENTFLCVSDYNDGVLWDYHISAEYNLNATQSDLAHIYLPGRFLFFDFPKIGTCSVWAVAELPGEAYSSPDHSIEHLYLQRRESREQIGDVFCKLHEENISRICVAEFNSEYFTDKISFPHTEEVSADCGIQTVSFQTKLGEAMAQTHKFEEWMIDCKLKGDDGNKVEFGYLLSYAYEINQIFVYFAIVKLKKFFPKI